MTIYIHYTGNPRPAMPENCERLGGLTIQHMSRTEYQAWYSDNPEQDVNEFNTKKEEVKKYNQRTCPPAWM